jgi:ribosomal protein L7/L12
VDPASLQKLLDDINAEIASGNKITAIKLYREATGVGLAEAKEAVELIAAGKPPPSGAAPSLAADAMQEVSALIAAGRKIDAIKAYRKAVGVDLKDAKDTVEALEARINPGAVMTRDAAMRRVRGLVVSGLVVAAAVAALVFLLTRA